MFSFSLPYLLLHAITGDDNKQKQGIYKFYYFTKGGTDIADQRNDNYTVRSQSNRWDLVIYYILGTIRMNSKTLFSIKKDLDVKKENTFELAFELAESLTYAFIEQRRINGLGKSVTQKIDFVLKRQSTSHTVSKIERFRYFSYKRKCFMYAEKSNRKK